ncbi:MAG: methylmalonyl-CoA mutase [Chloroflexi bacterium]|nr:methylmalonyl-CoA mutase [Chloroflexota bacterium]
MFSKDELQEIQKRRTEWEGTVKESLKRFKTDKSPNRFYTPLDIPDFDFLETVGFPGEYPFTAGTYPSLVPGTGPVKGGGPFAVAGLARAGRYSGYGMAEDTRDYYRRMIGRGWRVGPNLAFDLPTQIGYDPDHPMARGEVGKTGVAVSSLKDFETIFEPFTGDLAMDRVATAMNINAPAIVLISMFVAVAQQKGVPLDRLRCTPQNDILKEYTGRGTYIFPPKPSLRLTRDIFVYARKNLPQMNLMGVSAHFREGGCDTVRAAGFQFSNALAYVQVARDGGLDIDDFLPSVTFQTGGCHSMEILKAVAEIRACRRVWAKLARERLGARSPRSWMLRSVPGRLEPALTTRQRPLNNLIRATLGGVAIALGGDVPTVNPGFDEALGLGVSLEAQQLSEDGARILFHEARLCDVQDPFAGSYYMEALTGRIEAEIFETIAKVDSVGGAVAAIETGFMQRAIAQDAYRTQKQIETGEKIVVGVNSFLGPDELEVNVHRQVAHPYDPKRREEAEEKQVDKVRKLRQERDNARVMVTLKQLREQAGDEKVNLFPAVLESVKAYATIGEICGVLRDVFGEYQEYGII